MQESNIADEANGWLAGECHAHCGGDHTVDAVGASIRYQRDVAAIWAEPLHVADRHRRGCHECTPGRNAVNTRLGNTDLVWLRAGFDSCLHCLCATLIRAGPAGQPCCVNGCLTASIHESGDNPWLVELEVSD